MTYSIIKQKQKAIEMKQRFVSKHPSQENCQKKFAEPDSAVGKIQTHFFSQGYQT
jgi:hypothetical protein